MNVELYQDRKSYRRGFAAVHDISIQISEHYVLEIKEDLGTRETTIILVHSTGLDTPEPQVTRECLASILQVPERVKK